MYDQHIPVFSLLPFFLLYDIGARSSTTTLTMTSKSLALLLHVLILPTIVIYWHVRDAQATLLFLLHALSVLLRALLLLYVVHVIKDPMEGATSLVSSALLDTLQSILTPHPSVNVCPSQIHLP